MKCTAIEPPPRRCFAPKYMKEWLESQGIEYLGDTIHSPGQSNHYQVISGPVCRLYFGNGKAEPHSFESSWFMRSDGSWGRSGRNYLSYRTSDKYNEFVTVRWESPDPIQQPIQQKELIAA